MNILIVEDEAIIAEDIRQIALALGHQVRWVATGEKAEEYALTHWPEIILMDVNLQEKGDGVAAVAKILASSNIPVIFVTSVPISEVFRSVSYLKLHCGYLSKPIDHLELATAIQQAAFKSVSGLPVHEGARP
jgi:DNA-binding response OmpR family regulator